MHDPEKPALGLDPRVQTFRIRSCIKIIPSSKVAIRLKATLLWPPPLPAHFLACRWRIGKGGWAMVKRRTGARRAVNIPPAAVRAKNSKAAKAAHWINFPNEPPSYRKARNALLTAEIELRRAVERVAAQRRKLPAGGLVPEDYIFEEGGASPTGPRAVRQVRLSELFGERNTLVA